MGNGLQGKRIALGGSRKVEDMCKLIEKQGGIPMVRSLQGITFLAEKEVEPDLLKFVEEGADWVIFTTGIGLETLVDIADKLAVKEQFLNNIRQANVASRGYKTLAALKKLDIHPVEVDVDGTNKGLTQALESKNFKDQKVLIQLHGESAPVLTQFFEERGAKVSKILPYQHISPDKETITKLCDEILNHQVDAVCFTTAVQVRSLFHFAREKELYNNILKSFHHYVLAAAVGKVTAEALKEEGIKELVTPEIERMGAMVVELSRHYEKEIPDLS